MARRGWRRNLFLGGVGCVGLVVLLVGLAGMALLWAGMSYRRMGPPEPEAMARQIPLGPALAGESAAAGRPPIRLEIDLRQGMFTFRPGEPGSEIAVEGSFAGEYFELVDERGPAGETGQEVRIALTPRVGYLVRLMAGLTHFDGEHPNQLTITLPPDVPMDLTLRVEEGVSELDLGGLDLTGLTVDLAKGEHELDFSRPLARDLPRLDVRLEMGEGRAFNLGNARPGELRVSTRMGDFRVGLAGAWPPGSTSTVDVEHAMGDLTLLIPDEVRVDDRSSSKVLLGGSSSRGLREDGSKSDDAPLLTISATTSMGGITIRRY